MDELFGMSAEEDAELAEIQKRKMLALQQRLTDQEKKSQFETQKQTVLRTILTNEARQRLTNVKLVKPEFAEQLELQLIQSAQTGKIREQITDEQLKAILIRLQSPKREMKIRRL